MPQQRIKLHPLHFMLWPALVLAFGILLTVATTTQARADYTPLLILADDEDPRTVTRKSSLFKELVSQLAVRLDRLGFPVIDEDTLLAGLDREIPDRRTQEEQVLMVRDTAEHGMTRGIRVFVQLGLSMAARQATEYGTLRIEVHSEIFTYPEIQFLNDFLLPPFQFTIPADCNRGCIVAHAKKSYEEIAGNLAVLIAKTSSAFVVADVAAEPNRQDDADIGQGGDAEMMYSSTPFTVTLRHFKRFEALTIVGVMADEFPGYEDHDLIALNSTEAQYLYVTSATRAKLLEWFNILLSDMGFEVDAIAMTFSENDIVIENTAGAPPGTEAD